MHLRQLEYFVACAELLNFTRAAERCFITQTAMTQQIRSLENTLGVSLFYRNKHRVELTRSGALFYSEAKEILRRSEAAIRLAQTAEDFTEGHLAVGFIKGYGHSDLAKALRLMYETHPGVRIELVRENEAGLLQMLQRQELDLIFSVTPYASDLTNVERLLLREYPLVVVMAAGHPMAEKPYLTYQDLKEERFLLMEPHARASAETEEARIILERGGYLPNVVQMEGEPETLLLQAAYGAGISILPEYVIHHTYTREDLRIVPLVKGDHTAETLDFEALWRTDGDNPALAYFLDIVRGL
ncbi:MAG: LysR family transcriptional regulator [Oscillospiraceae bacterium]|nr:LysR family transcriptional regulator [Oscillospiraceae bacterium]